MENTVKEEKALVSIEKIIKIIAGKEGYKDYRSDIRAITTNGANYMGDLYLIDIVEDTKATLKLFAKVANTSEQARVMVPTNKIYETEIFMYTTMADTYDELQNMHAIPEEKRFKFPKCYGSSLLEMEELIVLENLAAQGYEVYDRFKPIDWEFAKAAVEEIAKFHALSFALEKENPNLFKQLIKDRKNPFEDNTEAFMESLKLTLPLALSVVEKTNYGKVKKFIDDNGHKIFSSMITQSKHPVLMHGDYRMSNIMVKYQNDQVVSLKPIDYQTISYNCPVVDLLYFLFTGSDEKFRQQYYEKFFLHYHDTLTNQLELMSHDVNEIYPRSAFYFDLKDRLVFGFEVSFLMLNTILVDPSEVVTVEEMMKGMNTPGAEQLKPNSAYAERINGVVRDFVRWGILKDEDIPKDTPSIGINGNKTETKQGNAPVNEIISNNNELQPATENIKKKRKGCCSIQ